LQRKLRARLLVPLTPGSQLEMPLSFFARVVEEKIRAAQEAGAFDNLPGKGKPLELEDWSDVPEDLRISYHVLKNAGVLPPEAQLRKEIHTLQDLLKHVEGDEQRKALAKSIEWKMIHLDLLQRRSLGTEGARYYGKRLVAKFLGR
jgi:Domain of unknown function (DUF1992)